MMTATKSKSTVLPTHDELLDRTRAECVAMNDARPDPFPACPDCGFPRFGDDTHWLFTDQCQTCGMEHVDELLEGAVRSLGRRSLINLLGVLAGK